MNAWQQIFAYRSYITIISFSKEFVRRVWQRQAHPCETKNPLT